MVCHAGGGGNTSLGGDGLVVGGDAKGLVVGGSVNLFVNGIMEVG
jgi:hypothetical protein